MIATAPHIAPPLVHFVCGRLWTPILYRSPYFLKTAAIATTYHLESHKETQQFDEFFLLCDFRRGRARVRCVIAHGSLATLSEPPSNTMDETYINLFS